MFDQSKSCFSSKRLLLLIALFLMVGERAQGQGVINQAPGIKADCLAIFGYYFSWPESANGGKEFVIGVLGKAPFNSERVTARVKSIKGKPIVIRQFASAKDYKPCHVLFVADEAAAGSVERTARQRLTGALRVVGKSPVLVVSESSGFATKGAIVNFYVDLTANKVRMQINRENAAKAKIALTKGLFQLQRTGKVVFVKDE